ncbi:hypothetical protein ALT721_1930016 [Alteromonas alvinellae]
MRKYSHIDSVIWYKFIALSMQITYTIFIVIMQFEYICSRVIIDMLLATLLVK